MAQRRWTTPAGREHLLRVVYEKTGEDVVVDSLRYFEGEQVLEDQMRIEYDGEVDVMYIELRDAGIEESDEVSEGVIVDYDSKGLPVGIEILDASKLLGVVPRSVELAVGERSKP